MPYLSIYVELSEKSSHLLPKFYKSFNTKVILPKKDSGLVTVGREIIKSYDTDITGTIRTTPGGHVRTITPFGKNIRGSYYLTVWRDEEEEEEEEKGHLKSGP